MGDKAEFITPSDPRWGSKYKADWVKTENIAKSQEDYYIDIVQKASYAKIAEYKVRKHIGEIWGNHEFSIRKHNHADVQENICDALKVPDLGFTCMLHIVFRRVHDGKQVLFRGFITHGSGDASTKGGKLMKLKKFMDQADADFFAMGHMHDIIPYPKLYLATSPDLHIEHRQSWGTITGTFLMTYTQDVDAGYGEMRNYDPVPIGCPVFVFDPSNHLVTLDTKG